MKFGIGLGYYPYHKEYITNFFTAQLFTYFLSIPYSYMDDDEIRSRLQ